MPTLREYGRRRREPSTTIPIPSRATDIPYDGGAYEPPGEEEFGLPGDYSYDVEEPSWWDLPVAGADGQPSSPSGDPGFAWTDPSEEAGPGGVSGIAPGETPERLPWWQSWQTGAEQPERERPEPWQVEAAAGQLQLGYAGLEWQKEQWGQQLTFEKTKWADLSEQEQRRFDFDKEVWEDKKDQWERQFTFEQERWGEQFGFEQQKWDDITTAQQEQFLFDKEKWEDEKRQWAEELQLQKDRLREMLKIQRLALRKPVWGI